jgi:hypothetical protein
MKPDRVLSLSIILENPHTCGAAAIRRHGCAACVVDHLKYGHDNGASSALFLVWITTHMARDLATAT